MLTAVVPLIMGLAENPFLSLISLSFAAASLTLVIHSWFNIRDYIHDYLEVADKAKPKG